MGTDIHLWIEYKKTARARQWTLLDEVACRECENGKIGDSERRMDCYFCEGKVTLRGEDARPYNGRNYRLFGMLAGVRSGEDPMFPPRGIPRDSSREYHSYANNADAHTPSWLTLAELTQLVCEKHDPEKEDNTYLGKFVSMITDVMYPLGSKYGHDRVRIVFFFDN